MVPTESKDPGPRGATTVVSGAPASFTVSGDAASVARGLREVTDLMAGTRDTRDGGTVKAPPAKAGYATTEFWLTILTTVGAVAASSTSNLPPRYAAIATAVSVSAYAFSRALAKL